MTRLEEILEAQRRRLLAERANRILNAARDGRKVAERAISIALRITGDITP
jgi:hypothetical protein